jgi:hypothetical protein
VSVTMMAEVGGEQVPLENCSWYEVAPCGCTSGATMAYMPPMKGFPNSGTRPIVTEEQAWDSFCSDDDPRVLARQKDLGGKVELGLRSEVMDRMQDVGCPHTPLWGIEPEYAPDGMVWATILYPGEKKKTPMHLVPTSISEEPKHAWSSAETACGKLIGGEWSSERYNVSVRWPCAGCQKKVAATKPDPTQLELDLEVGA